MTAYKRHDFLSNPLHPCALNGCRSFGIFWLERAASDRKHPDVTERARLHPLAMELARAFPPMPLPA